MKRGEIWWVNFDPAVGGEINKQRPAIIVSNDKSNRMLNRIQVVPLTSKVTRRLPGEVFVSFNGKRHKAVADQIKTVSKLRVLNFAGNLSSDDLKRVEQAIKTQLALT